MSFRHSVARRVLGPLGVIAAAWLVVTPQAATPRYFPDDPIQVDNDRALDASATKEIKGSNGFDFTENTFFKPGDKRDIRAVNVNSVDEVPDSSWFTNRIGRMSMTLDEIARGPNQF